ncbi:hypothetical protein CS542_05470 [Pedobacter sp. IW39]|nr:hypothetical protein CS542_05470 [Pedobacter sp. IW39]
MEIFKSHVLTITIWSFSSFSFAKWTTDQEPMFFSGRASLLQYLTLEAVLDYIKTIKEEAVFYPVLY